MKGKKLANLRKENNLTQQDLADKLDVSASTISSWENGKTSPDEEQTACLEKLFKKVETKKETNSSEKTITLKNIVEILYFTIALLIPVLFFVEYLNDSLFNIYNTSVQNGELVSANYYSAVSASIAELVFVYGYYIITNVANFAFYKIKSNLAFLVALSIEFLFCIINLKNTGVYFEYSLFLFPIISGIYEYLYNKIEK